MRKLPYQSSLQFIQRPQLLWNDIGDRKLWRGIQWIRRGPTVPSRLSCNAYQSNIPKPRSGVRWKHGMRRFSEYGNVASRMMMDDLGLPAWIGNLHLDHLNSSGINIGYAIHIDSNERLYGLISFGDVYGITTLYWLVVPTPLKNIGQWEGLSHILWKIKNVWNHQPVIKYYKLT